MKKTFVGLSLVPTWGGRDQILYNVKTETEKFPFGKNTDVGSYSCVWHSSSDQWLASCHGSAIRKFGSVQAADAWVRGTLENCGVDMHNWGDYHDCSKAKIRTTEEERKMLNIRKPSKKTRALGK